MAPTAVCLLPGYFSETHGTILHGKPSAPDVSVRVIAGLAKGWGIRGTARVFEIDPTTVLGWLVAAAEQLITMQPGEVQRWRFIGATVNQNFQVQLFFEGFDPNGVLQIAQDEVQFSPDNFTQQPFLTKGIAQWGKLLHARAVQQANPSQKPCDHLPLVPGCATEASAFF
jgi:hypothetical protein